MAGGERGGRGRGRGRGDANHRGGRGNSRGSSRGSSGPYPRPRGSPAPPRGGNRGGPPRPPGPPSRGGARRAVGVTLVDDSLDGDDDGYDDIGEYDDEEQRVVPATTPAPRVLHAAAALPVSVALASVEVVRGMGVAAKKGRGGWDDVDVGELTVMEMDRRMAEEQRQVEAQRLATERAQQWTQRAMHQQVVGMKAREAEQRLLQQAQQYSARMAQQHVGLGRHPGAGGYAGGKKPGAGKAAGPGRNSNELFWKKELLLNLFGSFVQSSTLLDGSSRDTLAVKLAASKQLNAANKPPLHSAPPTAPNHRLSPPSGFPSAPPTHPTPNNRPSHPPGFPSAPPVPTPTAAKSALPVPSVAATPPAEAARGGAPSPAAASSPAPTLLLGEEILAVRKEKQRLEKLEKQRQKAAKKAEQKEAKQARREVKKAEKEAKDEQREREKAEQKLKADAEAKEERKVQPSQASTSTAAERVHEVPPSTAPVVDELTAFLGSTAAHLDEQFDRLLQTTATAATAASSSSVEAIDKSLSALCLTSADVAQSKGVDYGKLDAAVLPPPASLTAEEEAALVSDQSRQEEEDADYLAYELQQRGDLRVDEDADDDYQPVAGDDDASPTDPAQPPDDVPDRWDEEAVVAVAEEDEKAEAPPARDGALDIDALDLRDLTEEEIIAAYIEQIQQMEDAERAKEGEEEGEGEGEEVDDDGLQHDVSAEDMSSTLRPHLLNDTADDEEKQARRKELVAKRARDAAEGILDWENWSSDDDDEEDEEVEEDEVEEEEDGEEEKDLSASEGSQQEQWEFDSDDSGIQQQSTKRSPFASSSSSATPGFVAGSAEDPAHVAKQLEGFFLSPLSSMSFPPSTNAVHRSQIHRLAALYGLGSASLGSGEARYTSVTRLPSSHPANPSELSQLLAIFLADMTERSQRRLVRKADEAVAAYPSHPSGPNLKTLRKKAREEKQQAKAAKRQDKEKRALLQKMAKMKAQLKARGKAGGKGKNAWQQQQPDAGERGKAKIGATGQGTGKVAGRGMAVASLASAVPIPLSNAGHRLLLLLGWKGGGLGRKNDGIVAPVSATLKLNNKGLGA